MGPATQEHLRALGTFIAARGSSARFRLHGLVVDFCATRITGSIAVQGYGYIMAPLSVTKTTRCERKDSGIRNVCNFAQVGGAIEINHVF